MSNFISRHVVLISAPAKTTEQDLVDLQQAVDDLNLQDKIFECVRQAVQSNTVTKFAIVTVANGQHG
jgi:hypothetical protein